MADECEKKRDRITQSDMQHRKKKTDGNHKGRGVGSRTGINSIKHNNANIITNNITKHVKRNVTITTRKISRRERVDKNLQDISTRMQQTGQVLTAAGSALFKNMRPDRKYW
jgi:hypothetical protein